MSEPCSQMSPEPCLLESEDQTSYGTISRPAKEGREMMKKSKSNQVLLCCLANSALLGSGMSLGFTAVALPYMLMPDSTLPIDQDEASWIASLASIATPVGCLLSGHLLDRFGRRTALLVISAPLILGWLLIGLSPSLIQMYLGRISTGIGTGLCSIPATVYAAEVADSSIRGWLVTGTSVSIAMGVVIVYTLGALLKSQWQLVALICAAFPVLTTVLVFFFLPESPVWLVAKNRLEDASHALMRINRANTPAQVNEELQLLEDRARKNTRRSLSLTTTLKALSRPEAWKPLIIMNTFFFFQQFTGTFVVIFYAVDVVQEAGVKTDPFLVTVLIGLTRLVFTFLAAYLSKKFGRRPTAILSGVGMTLSLITLATHLYLLSPTPSVTKLSTSNLSDILNTTDVFNSTAVETVESVSFLPVTMLLLYILASTIGFLTLPWSMIGEVYPAQVRGVASGLTTCTAYGISFLVLKMYPHMKKVLDKHGVFYFFGIMALLGTIFVVFFLPETEGKTLQEIELQFMNKGARRSIQQEEEEVALQKSKKATIVKSTMR
ncbi:facilitated trehalose transporter Tret1-2 homolog isoform X2 [Macrosteles quadrilineatus]|uniref:facilitated trehalose transporter Tret1-2 homolog isoform X2 n=1 Tax=Macrosteles quadrilineatus TaxID=74068 RepID=UPI0023E1ACDC|nr:facilitated trehalose transporter Tret1-2 homolog isoform X2 [Macrosteles quadrilineatus]